MSFLQRFKGKTSVIDKEGIEGIVKQKAAPIEFNNENNDMSNQVNSQNNKQQENYNHSPQKSFKLKKASSYQTTQKDIGEFKNNNNNNKGKEPAKTKIITNIRQPQNNDSQSSSSQLQPNNIVKIRPNRYVPSSQSTAASSVNQFKRYSEQYDNSSTPTIKKQYHTLSEMNGYDYIPNMFQNNNQNQLNYNNNNNNNYIQQQQNNNNNVGQNNNNLNSYPMNSNSTESFKLKSHRSKLKSAEDYGSIFQNRLSQRVFSGAIHQPQQPMFSTGNYENQLHPLYINQQDVNQFNITDSYSIPRSNQIFLPQNYELIAIPKNQLINIASPMNLSQMQSNINSGSNSSRLKLPTINNSLMNSMNNGNITTLSQYNYQQQLNMMGNDFNSYNKQDNQLSKISSKQNLINTGKSVLEQSQNLPQKRPSHSSFRYELDFMEEKHRDIIDKLEKIREKRIQK